MELTKEQNKQYMDLDHIIEFNYDDRIALKNRVFDYMNAEIINQKLKQEDFIKWLEDRIKETTNAIERLEGTNSYRITNLKIRLSSYQEILDILNKGVDE